MHPKRSRRHADTFLWQSHFLFEISFLIESSGPCMSMISALISLGKNEAILKTSLHFRGSLDLLIRHNAH